jgi:hypothetical protein
MEKRTLMENQVRRHIVSLGLLVGAALAGMLGPAAAKETPNMNDRQVEQLRGEVNDLLDREAIRQLPITYSHFVRTRDIDGIVNLFTADGELILSDNIGQGTGAKGSAALRTFYDKSISNTDPWPFIHNHHIVMLGNGRAKGYVYVELRYGSQDFRTTTIGVYEDEYEKKDGGWKFRSRRFTGTPVKF